MPLILYVDDEARALKYMQHALEAKCELISCAEIQDALQVIEARGDELDVVIADERMPFMTGRDLLRVTQHRNESTARILTTAFAEVSCLAECLNEGLLDRVILKPWDPDEIVDEVLSTYDAKFSANQEKLAIDHFSNIDATVRRLEFVTSALQAQSRFSNLGPEQAELISLLESEVSGIDEIVSNAYKNYASLAKPTCRETCDLARCLEAAVRKLPKIHQQRVCSNFDTAAGPTLLRSSETLLVMVLVELLTYAFSIAADSPNESVSVSVRIEGAVAIITVIGGGTTDFLGVTREILIGRGTSGCFGLTVISWIIRYIGGEFKGKFTEAENIELTLKSPLLLN